MPEHLENLYLIKRNKQVNQPLHYQLANQVKTFCLKVLVYETGAKQRSIWQRYYWALIGRNPFIFSPGLNKQVKKRLINWFMDTKS
jgi:hypothetical protein